MALTSRSGTCINHGSASFSASLLVTFVSRDRDRGRRLSIYSQMSVYTSCQLSADRVIHKELQNEMKTTWEAKSIKGGKMIIEKDLSVCCKAAKPGKKNEKPSLSSLNTHKESNSIIF